MLNKIIIILMKNWNNMSMISIHFFIRTLSIFLLVGYPCHYCKLMKSYYLMILKQVTRKRRLRQWTHTRSMTTLYPPLVSLTAMHDHTSHITHDHTTRPHDHTSHITHDHTSHITHDRTTHPMGFLVSSISSTSSMHLIYPSSSTSSYSLLSHPSVLIYFLSFFPLFSTS